MNGYRDWVTKLWNHPHFLCSKIIHYGVLYYSIEAFIGVVIPNSLISDKHFVDNYYYFNCCCSPLISDS